MKSDNESRRTILAYLAKHNALTLATEREGRPFACPLFYVNDAWSLHFVSDTRTRHAQNIAANPRVAVTIHDDDRDARLIQGVQLEGECSPAGMIESAKAALLYAVKFPMVRDLRAAMVKAGFYTITPRWVRFIDNTRGFGFKEEFEL